IVAAAQLAQASDEARPPTMAPRTFETLRDQAAMQVAARANGHAWEGRESEPARGFELLPPPSDGDLFFDIEGDPFWEARGGLEYLWGVSDANDYRAFWAHDRASEKLALESLVDFVRARLEQDPHLHVYHYASYEPSALKR